MHRKLAYSLEEGGRVAVKRKLCAHLQLPLDSAQQQQQQQAAASSSKQQQAAASSSKQQQQQPSVRYRTC
jgi:small-conductance mechanosensitive channel